jgi:hypothetical protein
MSKPSSVTINGMQLKPAPFVSTSYEYNKSGEYVIGGFLIVTLSGTLVGEDIVAQMQSIGMLSANLNCVNLIIGCQGGSDFLDGAGRIKNVDVSSGDQPFVANYTITIALETVGGSPAVDPDPDFLTRNCLNAGDGKFIQAYSESIEVDGGDSATLVDNTFGVSKSYIKGKGSIKVTAFGREVCGVPSFNGVDQAIAIVNKRAAALMSFTYCGAGDNPLQGYSGWQKWLDTKSLIVNDTGSVEWTFDLYMSQGGCAPYAWVDISTDDRKDFQIGTKERKTRSVSGTIRGLSSYTGDLLSNKADSGDRISNAKAALGVVLPQIMGGEWPGLANSLSGEKGQAPDPPDCPPPEDEICYQRISSNITTSVVAGEISFSAEYADIDACKPKGVAIIETTVEETLPAVRYVEFIVPNLQDSIIHYMGNTAHEASVTVRGSLQGCDEKKIKEAMECVDEQFGKATKNYNGWLIRSETKKISTYSYSKTKTFVKCDS